MSLFITNCFRLVKKTPNLTYADIGRLEVGTETLVDKSKSVKSVLMKLFEGELRASTCNALTQFLII